MTWPNNPHHISELPMPLEVRHNGVYSYAGAYGKCAALEFARDPNGRAILEYLSEGNKDKERLLGYLLLVVAHNGASAAIELDQTNILSPDTLLEGTTE